ncbi:MAG: sulfite oxidase [Halobacteriales archaeon]|nr:sulfite oxidase [Halobacteriales archaeon]
MTDAPDLVTERPLNAETPRSALAERRTPNGAFFVRDHFDRPRLNHETYVLAVTGCVERMKGWTLPQLAKLPQHKVESVMECAGNSRTRMVPKPGGVPWGDRAVACALWEGPALRDVLRPAGLQPEGIEVLGRGADLGIEGGRPMHFERSIPTPMALGDGPILALRMNGEPLPETHGAPVRLLVPGWYGVASVKWLTELRLLDRPFTGYFQKERYVWDDGSVVGLMRPKSLILQPAEGAHVPAGLVQVHGKAWGGEGGIASVEVRLDDGPWQEAQVRDESGPFGWCAWSHSVQLSHGTHALTARARDAKGTAQPLEAVVNKHGYGYNTAPSVRVVAGR